ncbi:MAG: ATP-binding protein [Nanoarchaeota archaeon]
MILGKIVGKVTTREFGFDITHDTKKFDYVQVCHPTDGYVLCQVVEIQKDGSRTLGDCVVIGYQDDKGKIRQLRSPFEPGTEVLSAEDEFIQKVIGLPEGSSRSAHLGKLEGTSIPLHVDLGTLLTKHVAVLAKSGAGKSYAVGVLLEEIAEKNIPVLVIDPHGEYPSMKEKNTDEKEIALLKESGLTAKGYRTQVFGDQSVTDCRPLQLSSTLTPQEIVHLFPGKLTSTQLGIIYSALKNMTEVTFTSLLAELEREESNAKWHLINVIEYLGRLQLFSSMPTAFNELLVSGQVSIINLRGINPDIQQIIVYKLCKDLFEKRKLEEVPPFFLVIEEAHNFCPERSFGEAKCSGIIRTIASEGRKFGLGLCAISQRPARVDKSVLSQCTTQIILKVTNPNDLKAISNSVEGLTGNVEREIQNLPIGNALICGVTDIPLFITIRPRKSMHGGHAVNILGSPEENLLEKLETFQEEEVLPIIMPSVSRHDLAIMHREPGKPEPTIHTSLIPAYQFVCKEKEGQYTLLVEMDSGGIVVEKNEMLTKRLPRIHDLTQKQLGVLQQAFQTKEFTAREMISKIGSGLDLSEELDYLTKQGYLLRDKQTYRLTNTYVLARLSTHANHDRIAYSKIGYDAKNDNKVSVDDVRRDLNRFTSVIDQKQCWIVKHDVA